MSLARSQGTSVLGYWFSSPLFWPLPFSSGRERIKTAWLYRHIYIYSRVSNVATFQRPCVKNVVTYRLTMRPRCIKKPENMAVRGRGFLRSNTSRAPKTWPFCLSLLSLRVSFWAFFFALFLRGICLKKGLGPKPLQNKVFWHTTGLAFASSALAHKKIIKNSKAAPNLRTRALTRFLGVLVLVTKPLWK